MAHSHTFPNHGFRSSLLKITLSRCDFYQLSNIAINHIALLSRTKWLRPWTESIIQDIQVSPGSKLSAKPLLKLLTHPNHILVVSSQATSFSNYPTDPSLLRSRFSRCHATLPPKFLWVERCVTFQTTAAKETIVMGALALSNLSFPQRFPRLGERLKETQCSRVYISLFSVFLSFTTYFLYRSETVRKWAQSVPIPFQNDRFRVLVIISGFIPSGLKGTRI